MLAAFTPETKEFLRKNRLVMSTVQKIIRSGMGQVATRDHYMSALAHPSVFEGKDINLEKMVTLAHGLKKEDVPPRIILTVKKETKPSLGVGYFGPRTHGETLFNSPGAIARVIRSTAQTKKMHVSAARTKDPNGHPLKYHWRI